MVTAPAVQPLSRAPAAFELIGRNRDYALHSLRISLRYIGYVAGRSSSSFRFRAASQGAAGLSKDSIALCHQVTTLDRAKLTQRIGELNSAELSQVEDGIKAAMDLP